MLEENHQYLNQQKIFDQSSNTRHSKQDSMKNSIQKLSKIDLMKQYNELRRRSSLQKLQCITKTDSNLLQQSQTSRRSQNQTCASLNQSNCELVSQINQKTQEFAKEKAQQIVNANQQLQIQLKEIKKIQDNQLCVMNSNIQQIQEKYNKKQQKLLEQYEQDFLQLKQEMDHEISQEQEHAKKVIEQKLEEQKNTLPIPTVQNEKTLERVNSLNFIKKQSIRNSSLDKVPQYSQTSKAITCAVEIDHLRQSIVKLKGSMNQQRNSKQMENEIIISDDEDNYYKEYLQFKRNFLEKEKEKFKYYKNQRF